MRFFPLPVPTSMNIFLDVIRIFSYYATVCGISKVENSFFLIVKCMKTEQFYSKIKKDLPGYFTLFLFAGVVVWSHLLSFFMFLMFIYLFTDVFTNVIHKKFPNISKKILFYHFYILLCGIFLVISLRVIPEFINDLPKYTKQAESEIIGFIETFSHRYGIEFDSNIIKENIFTEGTRTIQQFMILFKGISKGFIYFIFALVLNFLLFSEKIFIAKIFTSERDSLMTYLYNFTSKRIGLFYLFFKKVMGGQVIISLINAIITLVIVLILDLPHKISLVCLIFICGLMPIIGNIISNTILSVTALFSRGLAAFAICLIFLVIIHKLEYFLNSKIIGSIVNLPMFVTLLSLLLGQALLGVWGIIIAIPVVLFIKRELEGFEVSY